MDVGDTIFENEMADIFQRSEKIWTKTPSAHIQTSKAIENIINKEPLTFDQCINKTKKVFLFVK